MLTLLTVHDTLGWLTIVDMSIMQQVPRSVGDNMTVQHKYTHAHVTLCIVINQIRVKHNNTVRKETASVFCKRDYVTLPTACQGRCAVKLISACRYLQPLNALIVCIFWELKMYFIVISVSNTNSLSWQYLTYAGPEKMTLAPDVLLLLFLRRLNNLEMLWMFRAKLAAFSYSNKKNKKVRALTGFLTPFKMNNTLHTQAKLS